MHAAMGANVLGTACIHTKYECTAGDSPRLKNGRLATGSKHFVDRGLARSDTAYTLARIRLHGRYQS